MIDDQMAVNICDEVIQGMNQMVQSSRALSFPGSVPFGLESQYPQMVAQSVGVSADSVKTQIDRRRLAPKKSGGPSITTIYNVQGDNARWNINSNDNSVNVVTKSSDEFFITLRGQIESGIADGDDRRKILEAFTALQESHGKPSFAQRYTDFMAAAANHITVIIPFIPALTEMLHKVLG